MSKEVKVLSWCGIHVPKAFSYFRVVVSVDGQKKVVRVPNDSKSEWMSHDRIREEAIKLADPYNDINFKLKIMKPEHIIIYAFAFLIFSLGCGVFTWIALFLKEEIFNK